MTAEQLRLVRELRGRECRCGGMKREGQTFCARCFGRLPISLKQRLYNRPGKGYEESYAESVEFLISLSIKKGQTANA